MDRDLAACGHSSCDSAQARLHSAVQAWPERRAGLPKRGTRRLSTTRWLQSSVVRAVASRWRPKAQSCRAMASTSATHSNTGATAGVPVTGNRVRVDDLDYVEVQEGTASILFPADGDVFYNPVQEFNRDLSIAVISAFSKIYRKEKAETRARHAERAAKRHRDDTGDSTPVGKNDPSNPKGLTILEALSATGLRAIRYRNEIEGVDRVVANDVSQAAVAAIRRNIVHSKLDPETEVIPSEADASMLMYQHRKKDDRYDVVDLDPYGSAGPFLDAAVQAVTDGGLMCVTCTDMAVLAGNHGEACYAKYGSMSIRMDACHEMAVRIILHSIAAHAARHKRYIVPLISCSIDFYCRVFVRVYTSAAEVKRTASKAGFVFNCSGCHSFHLQRLGRVQQSGNSIKYKAASGPPVGPKCAECDGTFHLGGPLWLDPIHDADFVRTVAEEVKAAPAAKYGTSQRIIGFTSVIAEELPDEPLYYTAPALSGRAKCVTPSFLQIRSAILNAGYKVSSSHANKDALKTDAPPNVIWDIIRSWVKLNPVKNLAAGSPAARLLAKEPEKLHSFERHPDANPESRAQGISRFQENPLPFWGPKARAKKRKAAS